MSKALPRNKVNKQHTWNSESVFATPEAFESELKKFVESLPTIKKFQGHLGEKPDNLIEAMSVLEKLQARANKIRVYANMSHSVDTADQNAAAMNGKAVSALAQLRAAASFIDPELLSLGKDKLEKWIND
ncbi:MAG: hypothetical protein HZC38_04970, partial [Chloroflexi bacterium]|nr:hypothetical protein [Chloroflexota bacterium]